MAELESMPKYEVYKDSGVHWIGVLPVHWNLKRFKHHYSSAMGETILAADLVEQGTIPVYSATEGNHFFGFVNSSSVSLDVGDLVIPARGNSIGFPKLVQQNSTCTQTTIYAKKIKEFNERYCFYYLLGCKQYLFQFVQTAIPQITVDEVKNNWLVGPTLKEQVAIAKFLDKKTSQIDEAIDIKEKQIELLKERKQIIIQKTVTQGIDPNTPMKDSSVYWIGSIPEHWEVRRSKFLFTQRKERAWKSDVQLSATQAYGVIPQSEYEALSGSTVVKIQLHLDKRKHVEKDDFVISMRSFQGGLERAWSSGCIRSSYVVLKPLEEINPDFYGYLLKLPSYIKALQRTGNFIRDGQDLNFDNFSQVDLFIPPLEEQEAIAEYVKEFMVSSDKGIELLQQQIEKLKEYKTTLINSAVTGKIKVPGVV